MKSPALFGLPIARVVRAAALCVVAGVWLLLAAPDASAQAPQPTQAQTLAPNPEASLALQDRFDEFMRILNGDFARLKPELFSEAFREELPLGQFGDAIKEQYAQQRGFKTLAVSPAGSYVMQAWLRTVNDGRDWDLVMGIEPQRPYAIDSLSIAARPAKAIRAFDGWALLDRDLETLLDRSGFAAYEILPDGSTVHLHSAHGNRRMAIGLASRLWVLDALVQKIESGDAQWDQMLTLEARFKSLPALGFAVTPNGDKFRLRDFAERLMAHQDTTAFDHLLHFLGPKTVQALVASYRKGPDGPGSVVGAAASPDNPFLSTLDLYRLTCTVDATLIKQFAAASPEERQKMIDTVLPRIDVMYELFEVWAKPQQVESVGWFATAEELCSAAAKIWKVGQQEGMRASTLDTIKAPENPALDGSVFKQVWMITGGLPGAFAGTWIYERTDGRVFVMTFIFNNPDRLLDTQRISPIIEATQGLVGQLKAPPAK